MISGKIHQSVEYSSDSLRVPPYFNRVGPGLYENIEIEKIANKISTPGFKMVPEPQRPYEVLIDISADMKDGHLRTNQFVSNKLSAGETMSIARTTHNSGRKRPQHRFTDYTRERLVGSIKDQFRVKSARLSSKSSTKKLEAIFS